VTIATGQLAGRLVGFGAGVGEEHPVGEGMVHQLARQAQGRLVGVDVGHVPELAGLLGQGLDQRGMAMAQGTDGNAASEVDVFAIGLIPDARTLSSHRNERGGGVGRDHHLIEGGALHIGLRSGHRDFSCRSRR